MIQEWDFRKFERNRNEREGRFVGMCLGAAALIYLGACAPLDLGTANPVPPPAAAPALSLDPALCIEGGLGTASTLSADSAGVCADTLHLPSHGARS